MLEEPAPLMLPVCIHFLTGMVLVRLHGEFGPSVPADAEALSRGLAATKDPVVINVSAVTAMDTAGLRWVMRLTQEARRDGASLILESPTPCVEAVLTLTGCHTWFSAATRPGPDGRTDTARLIDTLSA
jgi:anti-anti-sigma factor